MNPCLADTGSTLPLTFIVVALVAIVAGAATLFFVGRRNRKRAMGTTTLALLLFGALAIGMVPSAPAHAETVGTQCSQPSPTPVTTTSTPTPTPTPTATPTPTPACTPTTISDETVSGWTVVTGGPDTALVGSVSGDDVLFAAFPTATTFTGHVVLSGGSASLTGDYTVTATPDTNTVAGDTVDFSITFPGVDAFETDAAPALTFTLPGTTDCPTQVTITGDIALAE